MIKENRESKIVKDVENRNRGRGSVKIEKKDKKKKSKSCKYVQ